MRFNDTDLAVFQVEQSTYDTNFTKTGLALRTETLNYSSKSGYVCYYIRDGEKVSKGSNVYSIDETGSMYDALYDVQNSSDSGLSSDDYEDLSKQIQIFKSSFSASDFSEVYEFKYSIDNKVLEIYEDMALEQLTSDSSFDSTFSASKSSTSGIVTYYMDGFEGFDINNLSADCFDKTNYTKESLKVGDIIESGKPVYKIIDNESWQIAVMLSKEEYKKIKDNSRVKFKINDSNVKISASFDTIEKDDNYFIVINMNRYMAQYVSDRYLDITFIFSETQGLKIPNSAITTKEVIMIPVTYLTSGSGSTSEIYFNQMVLTEDGTTSVVQIAPTIYFTDDHFCYVDPADIDEDAVLVANDSDITFSVTTAGKYQLQGVYCVTQGTALFRQIDIMVNGDDYTIVDPNTSYGISAYDRIVLDGTTVQENQVIY
jgi:putative membrane fusion protein